MPRRVNSSPGPRPERISSAGVCNAPAARITSPADSVSMPPGPDSSMPVARPPLITTLTAVAPVTMCRFVRRRVTGSR